MYGPQMLALEAPAWSLQKQIVRHPQAFRSECPGERPENLHFKIVFPQSDSFVPPNLRTAALTYQLYIFIWQNTNYLSIAMYLCIYLCHLMQCLHIVVNKYLQNRLLNKWVSE